jgi:small neutral amino acid transporter SnatA (MarC family)
MNLPPNLLSAFVTVFVTIGPIETAVVFAALTAPIPAGTDPDLLKSRPVVHQRERNTRCATRRRHRDISAGVSVIAGPGRVAAVVLVMGRTEVWLERAAVVLMVAICLAVTYVAVLVSERLVRGLGQTGSDVVGRISGVLLAGLDVQFIFDGVRQAALFAPA